MEGNGLPAGRMFSNMGGGMLGLEMTLHPPQTTIQNPLQNPQNHLQIQPQVMTFSHQQQYDQQTQLSMMEHNHSYNAQNPNPVQKHRVQTTQLGNSDEDEPVGWVNDDSNTDGKRKIASPWHRMKWTDSMVRLLIVAVYYMGDEGGSELGSDKKKLGGGVGGGGGLLQKKGKWKSVSRAMMEKGFFVSPQQCEDKFNDLNKRYKRVNDILGKGTACRVVENQSLLETMDLSPKLREEVKKLLGSKHLFFREMCAYHNSCGHGTVGPTTETAAPALGDASHHQQQQQLCLHASTSSQMLPPPPSMMPTSSKSDNHEDEHDDEEDEDDEEEEEDESEDEEEEQNEEGGERKRARRTGGISSNTSWALQKLKGEITGIFQDASKSGWEKKQWVKTQLVKLEEEGVKYQYEGLELEKQRLKWMKFSSRKEREMEKMKIDNEKNRLENERMMLLLRQKEIDLLFLHQSPSNPSCVTA